MELSRGKRWLLGVSLIIIVVGCFFSGFMLGKVKPSKTVYTSIKRTRKRNSSRGSSRIKIIY